MFPHFCLLLQKADNKPCPGECNSYKKAALPCRRRHGVFRCFFLSVSPEIRSRRKKDEQRKKEKTRAPIAAPRFPSSHLDVFVHRALGRGRARRRGGVGRHGQFLLLQGQGRRERQAGTHCSVLPVAFSMPLVSRTFILCSEGAPHFSVVVV